MLADPDLSCARRRGCSVASSAVGSRLTWVASSSWEIAEATNLASVTMLPHGGRVSLSARGLIALKLAPTWSVLALNTGKHAITPTIAVACAELTSLSVATAAALAQVLQRTGLTRPRALWVAAVARLSAGAVSAVGELSRSAECSATQPSAYSRDLDDVSILVDMVHFHSTLRAEAAAKRPSTLPLENHDDAAGALRLAFLQQPTFDALSDQRVGKWVMTVLWPRSSFVDQSAARSSSIMMLSLIVAGSCASYVAATPGKMRSHTPVSRVKCASISTTRAPSVVCAPTSKSLSLGNPSLGVDAVSAAAYSGAIQASLTALLGTTVADDVPLMSVGLDSISATEFTRDLSEKLHMELPSTLLFDHPSVGAIAAFVAAFGSEAAAPLQVHELQTCAPVQSVI